MDSNTPGRGAPSSAGRGTAALYFDPDALSANRPDLLGRDSAGEGFVQALARHGTAAPLACLALSKAAADGLRAIVEPVRGLDSVEWIPMTQPERLADFGCLAIIDTTLPAFAWQRRAVGQRLYALCGMAYSPVTATVARRVTDLLQAPVQAWDALVCVSTGVQRVVEQILDQQVRYLEDRFDAKRFVRPMLPVIPLGVEPGDYILDGMVRNAWRKRLGIGSSDFAVLTSGRLSASTSANPLPLFAALEEVASRVSHRIHLVHAGWFGSTQAEAAFRAEASGMAPSVNHIYLDGRDAMVRRSVWAAADVFAHLADNVQETFAMPVLEAMASSLPVVVSDWNGLKDIVRPGVDGFRIPTLMPPHDSGLDIAARYMTGVDGYDQYIGHAAMFSMVDIGACATAFETLARNADLRQSMGETGRKRVREAFSWQVVIRQYEELWALQADMRGGGLESVPLSGGRQVQPAFPDPFMGYASFPTRAIRPDDHIAVVDADAVDMYERLRVSPLVRHARSALPPDALCRALLDILMSGPQFRVRDVVGSVAPAQRRYALRALVWFSKLGIVKIEAGGGRAAR